MSNARLSRHAACHAARHAAFALAAAFVIACSSAKGTGSVTESAPATPGDAGLGPTADAADAAVMTPAPAPTADADSALPPPGECSSEAAQAACITCCTNAHMDGSTVYFVALIDCMCLTENCAKECAATLCDPQNPKNADADCQTCIQAKNSACTPSVKSTCTADVGCTAFDACIGKSDCAGKSK